LYFGCLCFLFLRPYHAHKLDFCSSPSVLRIYFLSSWLSMSWFSISMYLCLPSCSFSWRCVSFYKIWKLYVGKLRQFSRTFMKTICSNSDVSNDVLFRQKDKDCHQVKMWPPTQQLVIKSIVPNFSL
jgi:hypothetical protein